MREAGELPGAVFNATVILREVESQGVGEALRLRSKS